MMHHVVTARLYTGGVFFLCLAASGKLGGWCTEVKQALTYSTPGEAGNVFDMFCMHLQNPTKRCQFDPDMLVSMREVARLLELGVGYVNDTGIIYQRRRILDISPPGVFQNPVLKLSKAA
jgi:hypothetical protein